MTCRRKIMRVVAEVILGLGQEDGIRTLGNPIPRDARITHRFLDDRGDLCLVVESESFEEVKEGDIYPTLDVIRFQSPGTRGLQF